MPRARDVPKALVTVNRPGHQRHPRGNHQTTMATYTVALLPPGHYQVEVEKPGFRKAVQARCDPGCGSDARVDFTLQVGYKTRK